MKVYLKYTLSILVILMVGVAVYFFFSEPNKHTAIEHQNEEYTCPMHPQIIRDRPGNCPICGMALVKIITEYHKDNNSSIDNLLQASNYFIAGNYQTTTAKDTLISNSIELPGIIAYDQNSVVTIAARMSGRIEHIYINFKYQKVTKGQKLFDLYSPELLTEQQNFIFIITNDSENKLLINASKQKLLLYGMTPNQIAILSETKKANPITSIYSPAAGIIAGAEIDVNAPNSEMQSLNTSNENVGVKQGDYIQKEQVVFKLINTQMVWAVFNVDQASHGQIKVNDLIKITTEFDKGEVIDAKINFIETAFKTTDKSNSVRVYLDNNQLKLPIGLRLKGVVNIDGIKGIWIPKQSVVSIGSKKIVFLKVTDGFRVSAVETGIETDLFIEITAGISVNDKIAKNAQYLVDSESFIKTEQ